MTEPYFAAFFDESGIEKFNYSPPPKRRGSEWFILSAVLCRWTDMRQIKSNFQAFKNTYKQPTWAFHFVKASHDERIGFITHMTSQPIDVMTVIINKSLIRNTDGFGLPYYMYFYAAKLLIERLTWHCARYLDVTSEAGFIRLFFSDRRGLKKANVAQYLAQLRAKSMHDAAFDTNISNNTINWSVLQNDQIEIWDNKLLWGLQYADAVASGVAKAIELNEYGLTEHRYIKLLAPVIHKYNGTHYSYGLKFFPTPKPHPDSERRFRWMHQFK